MVPTAAPYDNMHLVLLNVFTPLGKLFFRTEAHTPEQRGDLHYSKGYRVAHLPGSAGRAAYDSPGPGQDSNKY